MTHIDWEQRARAAERTVAVLKAQVHQLYNEGPQTPIHRQIERARQRDAENLRRRAVAEAKSAELQRYSQTLEAEVADRTRAIRAIVDNVTFGFIMVDGEGRVREGWTRSCLDLLGRAPVTGAPLAEALGLADAAAAELTMGVQQAFEEWLPVELSLAQLPHRFPIGGRVIWAEGRAVRGEDGAITGLLFSLTDTTALEAAQQEARQNATLLGIVRQRAAFAGFVQDAQAQLAACLECPEDQPFVRRAVHTVKGNAGCYQLDALFTLLHAIEGEETILPEHLRAAQAALGAFLEQNAALIGIGADGAPQGVEVSPAALDELQRLLSPLDPAGLQRWGAAVVMRPAAELAAPLVPFVERLGDRLERPVRLEIDGGQTPLDPRHLRPLLTSLTHLLRNAVDHGIEAPEERGDKPPVGRLALGFGAEAEHWTITLHDDGKGIDFAALEERAIAAGLLAAAARGTLDPAEQVALLFMDGLSSRAEASEISGRGVGMSAVQSAAAALGGSLAVQSVRGAGTTVTIRVPLPEALRAPQDDSGDRRRAG